MTIAHANKLVRGLVGEDDFHDVQDILSSYYDLAQRQIATTAAPIIKSCFVEKGKNVALPEELYRLTKVSESYHRIDCNHIFIEGNGEAEITYYAYPKKLYDDSSEQTEFEIAKEAQMAIPYFAAAQVVLADSDMRRYYAFMDMYNGILSNISAANMENSNIRVVTAEEMR